MFLAVVLYGSSLPGFVACALMALVSLCVLYCVRAWVWGTEYNGTNPYLKVRLPSVHALVFAIGLLWADVLGSWGEWRVAGWLSCAVD